MRQVTLCYSELIRKDSTIQEIKFPRMNGVTYRLYFRLCSGAKMSHYFGEMGVLSNASIRLEIITDDGI